MTKPELKIAAPNQPRKPRARGGAKPAALRVAVFDRVRQALSITVPAWAAGFAWVGGDLLHVESYALAGWAYGFVGLIYVVSLPHVVDGLKRITGSGTRDAVCLGIVADGSMVTAESLIHFGGLHGASVWILALCGILGLMTASYANYVGFNAE